MNPIYVLYHANCYDGITAAWVARRRLGDYETSTAFGFDSYQPVSYGNPMPEIPDGSDVYIVDFSYPRDQLLALNERVSKLVVLDHHETARQELEDLSFATFDMDKSGAMLAWEYFFEWLDPPPLVEYVQDRDLWRFELPASREINAALRAYKMDFRVWDKLGKWGNDGLEVMNRLKVEGRSILEFTNSQVSMICKQARIEAVGGHDVPVVNATAFWSEVGEHLLELYPDYEFAASYFDRADGVRQWSLRSRPGFDVSEVAKSLGGGGHKQAAGFTENLSD